ncbi:LLM class flavin-dependent oxidoreductase [Streptomyces sp. NBC_00340]|uniref:LLM class flavin-dependent oxidoreductase n=1 Tax=Streptomyces sp. NBC_00340 TaxID=2975716 RepID=UPI00224D15BE|nr:LLM class flavin-dependent oxidoreductase [Streptomyces sp. NBC_00340]MCX5134109.1 LLM class flavin-dependent oxidoreductase [Streptomyces sp. NBC_00340]
MSGSALHLAVELDGDGAHPAAWRRAAHSPDQLLTPRRLAGTATVAENAGFTLITLDDGTLPPGASPNPVGRIGAVERAAFVAASTTTIGIAPVVAVTYAEPFHVSSQLASLDHISEGRAGWVVAEEDRPEAARTWGRPEVSGPAARARESRDGVRVARALWDSWEDDAVIRSVATSRYLDRERLHYIDFTGESYAVKGPAIVPRPPQGQLVVLGRPDSVPAAQLDVALVTGRDLATVGGAAASAGTPLVLAEVEVALDTLDATGTERVADLERYASWTDHGRLRLTGSAEQLVLLLAELSTVVDGVRLHPLVIDEDLPVLSQRVLPALSARRLVTRRLPGTSLRTTLGLDRPANRFAAAAVQEEAR